MEKQNRITEFFKVCKSSIPKKQCPPATRKNIVKKEILTEKQIWTLQEAFIENPFCKKGRKQKLAENLNIDPERVLVSIYTVKLVVPIMNCYPL